MNPVEKRVFTLQEYWQEFSETDTRVLRWLAEGEDSAILRGFFNLQAEQHQYHLGDVFFSVNSIFSHSADFQTAILKELREDINALQNSGEKASELMLELHSEQLFPSINNLLDKLQGDLRYFVLQFDLANFSQQDAASFVEFLQQLHSECCPKLKVLVVDNLHTPQLDDLNEFPWVLSQALDLNSGNLKLELAKYSQGKGVVYELRTLTMLASQEAQQGFTETFQSQINKALTLAAGEKFIHQKFSLLALAASVALAHQKLDETLNYYQQALAIANNLVEKNDELGYPCLFQCLMATGTAYFVIAKDFSQAALYYQKAAATAEHLNVQAKAISMMEAWRMVGSCYVEQNQLEDAWEANWRAFQSISALPSEIDASQTTLPYVAKSLYDMTLPNVSLKLFKRPSPYEDKQQEVLSAFSPYLGDNWQQIPPVKSCP